jgi:hypothetical protein
MPASRGHPDAVNTRQRAGTGGTQVLVRPCDTDCRTDSQRKEPLDLTSHVTSLALQGE